MINMIGKVMKIIYKETQNEKPRAIRGKLIEFNDFVKLELADGRHIFVKKDLIIAIKPIYKVGLSKRERSDMICKQWTKKN